jgi:multiple sugar transport system permease protein
MKTARLALPLLRLACIFFLMFLVLAPFLWILIASFRPNMELVRNQTFLPQILTLENYDSLFNKSNYWEWVTNSLIVATYTVILSLPLIVAGAYSVYRTQYRGRNVLSLFLLSVYVFPTALLVVPVFRIFAGLSLVDSHFGCALMNTALAVPFGIWLLQAFLRALPPELEEAAAVDGVGRLRTIFQIIIPQVAPGIIAIGMFAFIVSWTEYLFAMTLLLTNDLHTLPIGLTGIVFGQYRVNWGFAAAGAVGSALPVFLLFLVVGRWFIRGISAGAIK